MASRVKRPAQGHTVKLMIGLSVTGVFLCAPALRVAPLVMGRFSVRKLLKWFVSEQ